MSTHVRVVVESPKVSVRIPWALHRELEADAKAVGKSANQLAKERLVEALRGDRSAELLHLVQELRYDLQDLRKDLKRQLRAVLGDVLLNIADADEEEV